MHKIGKTIISILIVLACVRVCCRSPDVNNEYRSKVSQEINKNSFSDYVKRNLQKRLDYKINGLATAYLLGDKNNLTSILKEKIHDVGITHLIVISGMHLAILVGILDKFFKHCSRFSRVYFYCLFILAYVGVVGLTPSLLRATIVVFCQLFTSYFGRKIVPSRTLIFVITITLIIDPSFIKDIGWQLSIAAYTGILIFYPLIEGYLFGKGNNKSSLVRDKKPNMLSRFFGLFDFWSYIIMSLSVNLIVFPIILYTFGQFSFLSIVATAILTPLLPIILLNILMIGMLPDSIYSFLYLYTRTGTELLYMQIWLIDTLSEYQIFTIHAKKGNIWYFALYILVLLLYFFLRREYIKISKSNVNYQNQLVERGKSMQKVGTYLIEWQKQLQLRCQQQQKQNGITKTFDSVKETGRSVDLMKTE